MGIFARKLEITGVAAINVKDGDKKNWYDYPQTVVGTYDTVNNTVTLKVPTLTLFDTGTKILEAGNYTNVYRYTVTATPPYYTAGIGLVGYVDDPSIDCGKPPRYGCSTTQNVAISLSPSTWLGMPPKPED